MKVVAAAILAALCWACGPSTPSGVTTRPSSAPAVSSASSALSPSTPPTSPIASNASVVADPTLLRFVPLGGDGLSLTYDPATTAQVASDPTLATSAAGLAVGLYTVTPANASTPPGDDLAVVSVVNLRDPSVGDSWFRDWRDTYDEAACANAGGVVRHAQTTIGVNTVFIGSCAGGAFTYHVRLADVPIVMSLTSIGPGRIGEEIVKRMGG